MLAARAGHSRVVKVLLKAGADVTATDLTGMTAVHWYIQYTLKYILTSNT